MERAVFSSLIADRRATWWICGAATVHLALCAVGLRGWQCPVLAATCVPCPGCGISRASLLLVEGEWGRAMTVHAFAPVLVLALAMLAVAGVLKSGARKRFADAVRRVEMRTRASQWLLFGLVIYWIVRLALDSRGFAQLVH